MTRPEKISKRKAFNKEIRAHAAHEQTPFATVLTRALDFQKTRSYRAMKNLPSHLPRNAKRVDTDGLKSVDGVGNVRDENDGDEDEDEKEAEASKSFVVDLMGIAKPAKPKGIAKEFEVVRKVRNVIALDEDEDDLFGEYDADRDEWEEVDFDYDDKDGGSFEKRSYSAALKEG